MNVLNIFNGLDYGCSLSRADVTEKVCEIYKTVADVETCSLESSLDDLDDDTKSQIVARISEYYNITIPEDSVHNCADLVQFVLSNDGETIGDILNKNSWCSSEMLALTEQLAVASDLTKGGYAQEGLIGRIGDAIISMANTFKTNVFKFTKALKRSEMRIFSDGNLFLCKSVEKEPFTTFMDKDVDIPTGMITSYENATEYVSAVYEQLDAMNYGNSVLDALKGLRYKLYNNQLSSAPNFEPARQVMEKEKVIKWAATMQQKCYKDSRVAPKMKFKEAYASMEEFSKIKGKLLSMEDKLQAVDKLVDVMDDTSLVVSDVTNNIEENRLPSTFIKSLADGIRIVGTSFDLYGQTAMRQMALEHNHVINYLNLYKSL